MKRFSFRRLEVLLFCALLSGALALFVPRLAAQNAISDQGKEGEVLLRSDGGGSHDVQKDIYRLTKNVRVTQRGEDFILYTDDLVYYRQSNQALAPRGVRVESRDSTIRGAHMQANFNSKVITFLDNVTLNSNGAGDGIQTGAKPAKTRSELHQKPVEVHCDRLDYNYENKQAIAVGNVRIKQEESHGTCERIVYDESRNIARLMGNVSFTNKDGQTFNGQLVTVWVDDDKIDAQGPTLVFGPPKEDEKEAAVSTRVEFPAEAPQLPPELLRELRPLEPLSPSSPAARSTPAANAPATNAPAANAPAASTPPAGEERKTGGNNAAPVDEKRTEESPPVKTAATD